MTGAPETVAGRREGSAPIDRFPAFVNPAPIDVPILFLHVPKTGGTSVEGALAALAVARRRSFRVVDRQVGMGERPPSADLLADRSPIAYGAHCRYGFHALLPVPVNLCTVLRDPVGRVVSRFLWERRVAANPRSPTRAAFRRWLDGVEQNSTTKLIAGPELNDATALDRAQENLAGFFLIGTTDRLGDFVTCLLTAYGGPSVIMARPKHEPSPLKNLIAAEFGDLIADRNPLDVALHDLVRERYFDRVAEARAGLSGPTMAPVLVTNLSGKRFAVGPAAPE